MAKKKEITTTRIQLYLPPKERECWDRALALGEDYDSYSSMVRDLVERYYRRVLKKAGEECPE